MARQSSASFDEHERPTAQRTRPEDAADPNATTRIKKFELDQLVQQGSGTRPVITPEQIQRYVQEREATADESNETLPPPEEKVIVSDEVTVDPRERETIDALTLQRETLVIKPADNPQTTAQQIPIDVDLSRMQQAMSEPVPFAARRGLGLDQRQLTIAAGFLIAMVSALLGFIAGRL